MATKNTTGQNQALVRETNIRLILNQFKSHDMSTSDVANFFHLSNSGAKKIIDEILQTDILISAPESSQKKKGRRPNTLTLNSDYGILVVIDFFSNELLFCDICGKTLYMQKMHYLYAVNNTDIVSISENIKKILANRFSGKRLLSIAIVFVGKIHPDSCDIYMSHLFSHCTLNLKDYFSKEFSVTVTIKNNLHFAIIAEQEFGCLIHSNAPHCYLNVGAGITSAFLINDRLYMGATGLAGELGFNISLDTKLPYSDYVDFRAINNKLLQALSEGKSSMISERCPDPKNIHYRDIVDCFLLGDPLIEGIVMNAAYNLGIILKNLIELMDFDTIILSGNILDFGEKYFDKVLETVRSFHYTQHKIVKSKLGDSAVQLGAIELARSIVFDTIINERKSN